MSSITNAVAQQFAADGSTESSSPRIADLVTVAATRRPEAVALVVTADRVAISYRDVIRLADDLAGQLTRAGLLPGDRVALRSGSNAEFVVTLLAASRADLVVVPLDPALPVSDQRARAEASGARVVLVDGSGPDNGEDPAIRWWPVAVSVGRDDGALSVRLEAAGEPKPVTSAPEGLRPDDAMIMFTGGTTGLPKMVPWTHGNIASSIRAIVAGYRLGPQDATVAVMPLYHGHGLMAALLSTLASGGAVLLPARGSSRRTPSGTTSTRCTPPGTRRCRPFTRSCWSARRLNRPAPKLPCVSSAVAAPRSPRRRHRRCTRSSARRWSARSV